MQMDAIKSSLYTTVTTHDFIDINYINQLIALDIGMELAFLTNISISFNSDAYENDLLALNQELAKFKKLFIQKL